MPATQRSLYLMLHEVLENIDKSGIIGTIYTMASHVSPLWYPLYQRGRSEGRGTATTTVVTATAAAVSICAELFNKKD